MVWWLVLINLISVLIEIEGGTFSGMVISVYFSAIKIDVL